MSKKYFIVEAKCGHVGMNNYIVVDLAIMAENGKEAAYIARMMPRVKHHQKDAIRSVREVTSEEYYDSINNNDNRDYLSCSTIQEQRELCANLQYRIFKEIKPEVDEEKRRKERLSRIAYKEKKYKELWVR